MPGRRVVVADGSRLTAVEDMRAATPSMLGAKPTPELFARLQELAVELDDLRARLKQTRADVGDTGSAGPQPGAGDLARRRA